MVKMWAPMPAGGLRMPAVSLPIPPDTAELPHLRAIPGSAVLQRVPPRYRPRYALATVHIPTVSVQAGENGRAVETAPERLRRRNPPARVGIVTRHCIICGAALPPWRDLCAEHEPRQGHGMPPITRLVAF
jgi:hypothetical protein